MDTTWWASHGVPHHSWIEIAEMCLDRTPHEAREETLADILAVCLKSDTWASQPEEENLYAFLGLCWPYPRLQEVVHKKMQSERWSKQRRTNFIACITVPSSTTNVQPVSTLPTTSPPDPLLQPWREQLLTKKNGEPLCNLVNIGLILANHPAWQGVFWFDVVRGQPRVKDKPLTDQALTEIGQWLGLHERMSVSHLRPLEHCILAECHNNERDLLQHWLNNLPRWDGQPRLTVWLGDVAEVEQTAYGMAVSRLLVLSMVARALHPGCLYRYVVILEGPEESGKSSLVRTLAGEWYVELSMGLESKDAHMMLQGAWLAEMAELDSLTRTEETRLKSFITMQEDSWIPKYSNLRHTQPRRTIFIGTTNDESYLKGQTGNTRFLPLKTGHIRPDLLAAMREQLFAEALHEYHASPETWWCLPDDVQAEAREARELRRVTSVYEESLEGFLRIWPGNTITWPEIAEQFLHLDTAAWKDRSLQMQIMAAVKALGWKKARFYDETLRRQRRVWQRPTEALDHLGEVV